MKNLMPRYRRWVLAALRADQKSGVNRNSFGRLVRKIKHEAGREQARLFKGLVTLAGAYPGRDNEYRLAA